MQSRYDQLLAKLKEEIPGFRVLKYRESWFIRSIHFLVKLITFGKFDPGESGFKQMIGRTMYVPNNWDDLTDRLRYISLRHEAVHGRQFREWPFKFLSIPVLWRINFLLFSLAYLFVMIPGVWSMRAKFEREGYTQTLLTMYELDGQYSLSTAQRQVKFLGEVFSGPQYFWMWRKSKARKWAAATMLAIETGWITNERDRID